MTLWIIKIGFHSFLLPQKFIQTFFYLKHENFQNVCTKLSKKKGFWPLQEPQKRHCFHPGASSFGNDALGDINAPEVTSGQMLRAMMAYIWPKDDAMIRKRCDFDKLKIFFSSIIYSTISEL